MPQLRDGLVAPLTGEIVEIYSGGRSQYTEEQHKYETDLSDDTRVCSTSWLISGV